jgi:hypothetical protein
MTSQWVAAGMNGVVIGLNYCALPIVAPVEFNSTEWPDMFQSIRILEDEAMKMMRSQK